VDEGKEDLDGGTTGREVVTQVSLRHLSQRVIGGLAARVGKCLVNGGDAQWCFHPWTPPSGTAVGSDCGEDIADDEICPAVRAVQG
jgi:hypothetical protein